MTAPIDQAAADRLAREALGDVERRAVLAAMLDRRAREIVAALQPPIDVSSLIA